MKERGEIAQKLKQARFRHVKRELEKHFVGQEGKWDAEEVKRVKHTVRQFFETAPLHEVAARYPDVAALLWVLGDNVDTRKTNDLVPNGTLVGSMGGVMLWADDEEKASVARNLLDELADAALQTENGETSVGKPRSWWAWFR
tara:strand:+ start:315 stop:743 length:429 start_codon:yes stop_codon:yes gene_type:complete